MVRLFSLLALGAAALEPGATLGAEEPSCDAEEGSCALSLAQKRVRRRAGPQAGPAVVQSLEDGREDPTLWVTSEDQKARQEARFAAVVERKTAALERQQAEDQAAQDHMALILGKHGLHTHGKHGRRGKERTHPSPSTWAPAHVARAVRETLEEEPTIGQSLVSRESGPSIKEILAYESGDGTIEPPKSLSSRHHKERSTKHHAHHEPYLVRYHKRDEEREEAPKELREEDLVPLEELREEDLVPLEDTQFTETANHDAAQKKRATKQQVRSSTLHAPHKSAAEASKEEALKDPEQIEAIVADKVAEKEDYGHPEWLDKCNSIMLDVGSGRGDNVRKVFEPRRYQGSKLLQTLDDYVGSAGWRRAPFEKTGLCVLGLEPNEKHRKRLELLEDTYNAHGWRVHFYPFAAYRKSGFVELNATSILGPQDEEKQPGAHLMTVNGISAEQSPGKVRMVDIAAFVRSLPGHRVSVVLLDVEGAEYETLAQLMREDLICQKTMRRVLVAAHPWGDIDTWGDASTFPAGVHPRSFEAVQDRFSQLDQDSWCSPENTTTVAPLEDDVPTSSAEDWLEQELTQGATGAPAQADASAFDDYPMGPRAAPAALPAAQPPLPRAEFAPNASSLAAAASPPLAAASPPAALSQPLQLQPPAPGEPQRPEWMVQHLQRAAAAAGRAR